MTSDAEEPAEPADGDADRLAAIRAAETLRDLVDLTGADSVHGAYFAAKRDWRRLRARELTGELQGDGFPGSTVAVGDVTYHVHGITHADTPEERGYLRTEVDRLLSEGATVYCEQGVRSMYFSDFESVCEMDDYGWALARCRELDVDSHVDPDRFDGLVEDVESLASQFREAAFGLVDSGRDVYGERFAAALGDVASAFLTSHEDLATGHDFASFTLSRRAARNPDLLVDLQRYYETAFLPQPLEREWLRRHDPELELVTHARNERMAEYVTYHVDDEASVHVVCGAAHQPGVRYYLERYGDGWHPPEEFTLYI